MVIARRLLVVGGTATFPAPPSSISLTSSPNGGWNQQSDHKAAYYNGKTYLAWVDSSGNVEIAAYDHSTETLSLIFTLHAALEADVHVSPSVLVRDSDKRIMVVYTKHDQNVFYARVSTNPEDVTAFATEQELDSVLGGTTYTYPTIFQQLGQAGDPVVVMYRDVQGITTGTLAYTYTTDHDTSPTWQAQTDLYENPGFLSYWKASCDGNIRIDVIATDGHPTTDAPTKLYHMYSSATDWHATDGSTLSGMPFGPSDLTEIDDGSHGSCWPMGVVANGGNPCAIYWRGTYGEGDMDIMYARWNGSAWVKNLVANVGASGSFYAPGGAVIDEQDPDIVYAALWNGERFAVYRMVSADNGATWSSTPIDSGDTDDVVWPAVVLNGASELRVIWLSGTISDEDTFSLAIRGGA